MLKQLILDILTTKDGESFDNGRVLGTLTVLCFLAFTGMNIYFTRHFDAINFGTAAGLIFAGVGINLKLKETSEPNN